MDLRSRLNALAPKKTSSEKSQTAEASPSIGDRIARMQNAAKKFSLSENEIAEQLGGARLAEGVIRIDKHIPLNSLHGQYEIARLLKAPVHFLHKGSAPIDYNKMVFIDTETSGLAGGAGTIAFLLGIAKIKNNVIHLCQWLLLAFRGEQPMLEDALSWITQDSCLVSFNGKSFDIPLLTTRYLQNRMQHPFKDVMHLDLVHPTRRAFSNAWDDCRLQTAEKYLLKLIREDDIPGAMMPEIWTRFLRYQQADMLPSVLKHNQLDILSLPCVAGLLAENYANPETERCNHLGIAERHFEEGRQTHALEILRSWKQQLNEQGLLMLARLHRIHGQDHEALLIWKELAAKGSSIGAEHLAKYYEHTRRDFSSAIHYAQQIKIDISGSTQRRLSRLSKRLSRQSLLPNI